MNEVVMWFTVGIMVAVLGYIAYLCQWYSRGFRDMLLSGLLSAWFVCFLKLGVLAIDRDHRLSSTPSTTNHVLSTIDRSRLTLDGLPPMVDDLPFVSSSIKTTYHRRGCRYAGLMEHIRGYSSQEEAEADGKYPCKVCVPSVEAVSIARRGADE